MFVLKKESRTWWPVKVKWPDDEKAGQETEFEFEAEFKILDQAAIDAQDEAREAIMATYQRDHATLIAGDNVEAATALTKELPKKLADHAAQTFLDAMTNWRGIFQEVTGEDGKTKTVEVPFTRDLVLLALSQPRTRAGLQTAINEVVHGGPRSKN